MDTNEAPAHATDIMSEATEAAAGMWPPMRSPRKRALFRSGRRRLASPPSPCAIRGKAKRAIHSSGRNARSARSLVEDTVRMKRASWNGARARGCAYPKKDIRVGLPQPSLGIYKVAQGVRKFKAKSCQRSAISFQLGPSGAAIRLRVDWGRRFIAGGRGLREVGEQFTGDFAPDAVEAADPGENRVGAGGLCGALPAIG